MCAATNTDEKVYDIITYKNPGIVVIYNNKNFINKELQTRDGSDKDVSRISEVFSNLNFEVKSHLDQDKTSITNLIKEYSERDYSIDGCFICFIMSHGKYGQIITSDSQNMTVKEFIDPFKLNRSLKGKPKLFFIQSCRGKNKMLAHDGAQTQDFYTELEHEGLEKTNASYKIPLEADFLICHSTVEGYLSWRHKDKGSFYIQNLCSVITSNHDKDIVRILTFVNNELAQNLEFIMIPTFESRLRKALYLAPVHVLKEKVFFNF